MLAVDRVDIFAVVQQAVVIADAARERGEQIAVESVGLISA
jgi:hypothetical protein